MAGRTQWVEPTLDEVKTLMSGVVINAAQQTGRSENSSDDQDAKVQTTLNLMVEKVCSAIRRGNRTPVSLTAGTVPPDAHDFTLVLTISKLVLSQPNMNFVFKDGFDQDVKDAKEWLKEVHDGKCSVDYPVDPDQTTLPNYSFGGDVATDLSTDGPQAIYGFPTVTNATNPPVNLQAISGKGMVLLKWERPVNPPDTPVSYSVYRGTAAGQETQTPIATGLQETSYADTVAVGTYFYTVVAVNAPGPSGSSNEATAQSL